MLSRLDVDKLRSVRAPEASVLSLYVTLPLDPTCLPGVRVRAGRVISTLLTSGAGTSGGGMLSAADEQAANDLLDSALTAHGREWLGQAVAIFVCTEIGLLEVVQLPRSLGNGGTVERAVLAIRPHVRPLLAALQRSPAHWIVVVDLRHAWLLGVAEDAIESVARVPRDNGPSYSVPCDEVQSLGFGGWYGPASYDAHERVTELSRHPYRDAAAILVRAAQAGTPQPLVIGGCPDGVRHLLAELPHELRTSYAGCFTADPHLLTLARSRDLAAPLIAHWCEQQERKVTAEVISAAAGGSAVIELPACLAAVAASRVRLLLVRDEAMLPGYHCERCDALSLCSDGCSDWGAASRPVPDLLEEMVRRTLTDGGDVVSARTVPCDVAARLR